MNWNPIVSLIYRAYLLLITQEIEAGIVVTSLESSDEEELDADTASIVSPALLRKISNQTGRDLGNQLITLPGNTSQALILYKPLPLPGVACEEQKRDENNQNVIADDDAMDVEM